MIYFIIGYLFMYFSKVLYTYVFKDGLL